MRALRAENKLSVEINGQKNFVRGIGVHFEETAGQRILNIIEPQSLFDFDIVRQINGRIIDNGRVNFFGIVRYRNFDVIHTDSESRRINIGIAEIV